MDKNFKRGLVHGIPIMLGYISVAFGFGIVSVKLGLPAISAVIISFTNLTSAGQTAGVEIIAAGGSFIELALAQFIINIRYSLMGFSLSQKLDNTFTAPKRLLTAFGITDEIYAVAISQPNKITVRYMYGILLLPWFGWTLGTALGVLAGSFLPEAISNAMGIVLYGMFLAIILPPAKKDKRILLVVVIAIGLSCIFKYLMPFISGGFAVIISGVVASVIGALLCPLSEEELA